MKIRLVLLVLFVVSSVFSEQNDDLNIDFKYGDLQNHLIAQADDTQDPVDDGTLPERGRKKAKRSYMYKDGKNPIYAAGMSLLIPGAGEIYGEEYLRAGIFVGIEVGLLSAYYVYDQDGDDKTDEFHDYAAANFSEDTYYRGIRSFINSIGTSIDLDLVKNRDYWNNPVMNGNDTLYTSMSDYLTKDVDLGGLGLDGFTHNLPSTTTQQYYEMIGKYQQFAMGWNDFNGFERDSEGNLVLDDDGHVTYVSGFVPQDYHMKDSGKYIWDSDKRTSVYEKMRDEANEAYETGQNFIMIALVNHVASALDASFLIKSKYKVETALRIENNPGEKLSTDNFKVCYNINF